MFFRKLFGPTTKQEKKSSNLSSPSSPNASLSRSSSLSPSSATPTPSLYQTKDNTIKMAIRLHFDEVFTEHPEQTPSFTTFDVNNGIVSVHFPPKTPFIPNDDEPDEINREEKASEQPVDVFNKETFTAQFYMEDETLKVVEGSENAAKHLTLWYPAIMEALQESIIFAKDIEHVAQQSEKRRSPSS